MSDFFQQFQSWFLLILKQLLHKTCHQNVQWISNCLATSTCDSFLPKPQRDFSDRLRFAMNERFIHIITVVSNFCHTNYICLESVVESHSALHGRRTLARNCDNDFYHRFKIQLVYCIKYLLLSFFVS